jgi:hypothetical protein
MARRLSQQETFDPATNSQEAVQLGVRHPAFAAFLICSCRLTDAIRPTRSLQTIHKWRIRLRSAAHSRCWQESYCAVPLA